jgi:hypothetical protein
MNIEQFKTKSEEHSVIFQNNNNFSIKPLSETEKDLAAFQRIAIKARGYRGSDYETKVHENFESKIGGIDCVAFIYRGEK